MNLPVGVTCLDYVRIYADADGQSHFADVTVGGAERRSPVSTGVSVYSAPIPTAAVVLRRVVQAHPGSPHVSPCRQFVINLRGAVEVEVGDGEVRRIEPGQLILLEDTHGIGHITREIDPDRLSVFIELAS